MIFIGIDEPLWLMKEKNMSAAVQLAQEHVEELNKIYVPQVLTIDICGTNLTQISLFGDLRDVAQVCSFVALCIKLLVKHPF